MDRYRPILERQPFGRPPTDATAAAQAASSAPAPFRLCALMDAAGSVFAGLVNVQMNKSICLNVGEAEDGVTLVSVDVENDEARIQSGGQIWNLKLEAGPASAASAAPRPPAPTVPVNAGIPNADGDAARNERMRVMMERRRQVLEQMRNNRGGGGGRPE